MEYDITVIGGGPAGLAAAAAAKEAGADRILILERDEMLGGILNQCIHNGFGLHIFGEELTGPEYAARCIDRVKELGIGYRCGTMATALTGGREILAVNREDGCFSVRSKAVILAMGCRERPRGALNIPGYRPAGIYSAGAAQRLINIEGYMPGRKAVILGSGDIGLIMARRLTLEGAAVKCVAELMPFSGGLKRNIVQCLDDYNIPLKLSHTVVDILGKERVKGVVLAKVGEDLKPVPGTEELIECDTLLLSCGLIPENELSSQAGVELSPVTGGPVVGEGFQTSEEGIFACGNVLHVHDLVDYVTEEAAMAGESAAAYAEKLGKTPVKGDGGTAAAQTRHGAVLVCAKDGVRYTVPSHICPEQARDKIALRFRVGCVCRDAYIEVYLDEERILRQKKKVLTPGEMEVVWLKREELLKRKELAKITVRIARDSVPAALQS